MTFVLSLILVCGAIIVASHRVRGSRTPRGYRLDIAMSGRSGKLVYSEPGHEPHAFDCEFGGKGTLLVVYAPPSDKWAAVLPWAAGRRHAVLERVARETVRRKARGCRYVIHEAGIDILE